MNVDIRKVMGIAPDCLDNAKLLKSIMGDLYPEAKRDINIIMSVYDSGIPLIIRSKKSITTIEYSQYVKRIIDEYGIQDIYVGEAIDAWIDAILGEGIANKCRPKNISRKVAIKNATNVEKTNIKGVETIEDIVIPNMPNIDADTKLFQYKEMDGGYAITNYIGFDTKIVIPDLYNGKPVTTIDIGAFEKCRDIKGVILGNNIRTIGGSAFAQCDELEAVYNFENVTHVGGGAFTLCRKLSKINVTDSITHLGRHAFCATAIKSFKVPIKILDLPKGVLSGCFALEKVVIHDRVKTIGDDCFGDCQELTELSIPESVIKIGEKIIRGSNNKIERLYIKSDKVEIPDQAFFVKPCYNNLTIYCHAGSTAQAYCRKHNVKCVPLT